MRLIDLLTLPLAALWQQKLRTVLTTLGVVFGAFVLAASLSIREGVQETVDRESRRREMSRRVEVFPKWHPVSAPADSTDVKVEGAMTAARRERIRQALVERDPQLQPASVLTVLSRERLNKIAALPHVQRLVPLVSNNGLARLGEKSEGVQILSARPEDEACRRRLVAGSFFDAPDQSGVVISEFLAYRLGLVNDGDIAGLIGKPLHLEFRAAPPGTEVLSAAFPVVGILRKSTDEERKGPWDPLRVESDVLLPYQTALGLFFRGPGREAQGVNQAVLLVDSEANVKAVAKQIAELGVESRAAWESIEQERLIYLLIFGGMTCVAAVALLVSALGIANTMLMSVLERTREIGIMKAVGADNRHLQFVFLVEGALIGLLGGGFGLVLAWTASYPGDAWVHSMVMRDIKIDLQGSIFVFPPWMSVTVLLFTVVVTTLAAVYPARHAARIDPVLALRHE